jgi:hypothetical protein
MPERFDFPSETSLWMPVVRNPDLLKRGVTAGAHVAVGRLRDGVTLAAARAELEAINARLAVSYPATNRGRVPVAFTYAQFISGPEAPMIWGSPARVRDQHGARRRTRANDSSDRHRKRRPGQRRGSNGVVAHEVERARMEPQHSLAASDSGLHRQLGHAGVSGGRCRGRHSTVLCRAYRKGAATRRRFSWSEPPSILTWSRQRFARECSTSTRTSRSRDSVP